MKLHQERKNNTESHDKPVENFSSLETVFVWFDLDGSATVPPLSFAKFHRNVCVIDSRFHFAAQVWPKCCNVFIKIEYAEANRGWIRVAFRMKLFDLEIPPYLGRVTFMNLLIASLDDCPRVLIVNHYPTAFFSVTRTFVVSFFLAVSVSHRSEQWSFVTTVEMSLHYASLHP